MRLRTAGFFGRRSRAIRNGGIGIAALGAALMMGAIGGLIGQGQANAVVATGNITGWGPEARHVEGTQNGNALAALAQIATVTLSDSSLVRAYCIDLNTPTTAGQTYGTSAYW